MQLRALFLVTAILSPAIPSLAHDFWLEPDTFVPEKGSVVAVSLREGVDFKGNTLPYIEQWFSDFSVVTASGRSAVLAVTGDDPVPIRILDSGQQLLGYRSNRNYTELDAAKFNSYLEEEGIEFIREQRIAAGQDDEPAPEYFVRCAKALLNAGGGNGSAYNYELGLYPRVDCA